MVTTIRIGGYQGDKSVHTRGGRVFCDELKRLLGDDVETVFEENIVAQGNKAADLLSRAEEGSLDGCYFSSSYLAKRVPELGLFDQHFVVPDRHSAYAVLDGALGKRLAEEVEARTGYAVLGYWDNGLRHISSASVGIREPADCTGLKIRTLANEDHKRVFRSLGFEPMAIDVRDLPAAVKDGTVDAQENPLTNIYNFELYKTHRHVTLTRHLLGVALVLFNKEAVRSWSDNTRQAVNEALRLATIAQRKFAEEDDEICANALRAEGVEIIELDNEQRASFAAATKTEVDKTRANFPSELIALFEQDLARHENR
ncbi:MAG: TRAP transporter substrate-binding protein [Pseudomonadota bacterium]